MTTFETEPQPAPTSWRSSASNARGTAKIHGPSGGDDRQTHGSSTAPRATKTKGGCLSPELKEALCDYVDSQRAHGRHFDDIAKTLAESFGADVLQRLEVWHRQWKKRQWREESRQQHTHVPIDGMDFAPEDAVLEWSPIDYEGGIELIHYLVQGGLIAYEKQWESLPIRPLTEGQTCENVPGPGEANGTKWTHAAVFFWTGDRIDHVEPEARIRHRVPPASVGTCSSDSIRETVQMEKLHLRERLDTDGICSRLAALLIGFGDTRSKNTHARLAA